MNSDQKFKPDAVKKFKIHDNEPISTEEALTFGEVDRLYHVVDKDFVNDQ